MQEAQLRRLRALGIPGELGGTFPSVPQYSGPLFQLVCVLSIKEAGAETEIRVPEEGVAGSRGTEGHAPGRWETVG